MIQFTSEDLHFIQSRGSNPDAVQQQFSFFENGFDFASLDRPATIDDGIVALEEEQIEELAGDYENLIKEKIVTKFVPASGAASRMFKELYSYLENDNEEVASKAKNFLSKLEKFAFYDDLCRVMANDGYHLSDEIAKQNYPLIVRYILNAEGLNYGSQPKGLLKFHRYDDGCRTAVEEHLVEAAQYAQDANHICRLHFTVSPQHQSGFEALLSQVLPHYEQRFGVKYDISFSIQNPATDTLAAELDNQPFRDENGHLFFRPGGHGALIGNLNDIRSDIVFVKNIDNVITEDKAATTFLYKKALASYLIELQNKTFHYLKKIENGDFDEMDLCEMLDFASTELMINVDDDPSAEALFEKMNRPIRVCGMVKNEGEPGGGPFWIINDEGEESLQIVESSQMDKNDEEQMVIARQATHFNPVDMVCAFKNYKGDFFNLKDYVDENMGFISSKSYGDRTLKAMELPGLWNGAMAKWITVFVEVPLATFNPVKTVFDLVKR